MIFKNKIFTFIVCFVFLFFSKIEEFLIIFLFSFLYHGQIVDVLFLLEEMVQTSKKLYQKLIKLIMLLFPRRTVLNAWLY